MRLSHLSAAAVLVALVAAMFVSLGSVRADDCTANPDITLGFGDDCTITLANVHEKANDAGIKIPTTGGATGTTATVDEGVLTIDAAGTTVGKATVVIGRPRVSADGTDTDDTDTDGLDESTHIVVKTFTVNVVGFAIKNVAIKGDTDNRVNAGPQITVVATVRSAAGTATQVRLTVPTTGLSLQGDGTGAGTGTSQSQTKSPTAGGTQMVEFTVNTAGAPTGPYVLTFTADNTGFADNLTTPPADGERDTETLTITIGDPGTGLSSATLKLGNKVNDLPYTDKDETVAETGSAPAKGEGNSINLVIEAFDSLGGKANSGAINQIIVIAPQGTIASSHMTGDGSNTAGGDSSATLDEKDADGNDAVGATGGPSDVGQRTVVMVSKTDTKPGQVTVYAIVSGPGGAARTESITLTFSGPAASLSVGDATETLRSVNAVGDNPETEDKKEEDFVFEDSIKLLVTSKDEGGNNATPPSSASVVITGPDGKRVGDEKIEDTWPTEAAADGKRYLMLTNKGAKDVALKAGEYSVKVTSGKLEATAMFSVAGDPASVEVSASSTSSDTIGDVITVTATVTDKDGNTVADGTMVKFDVSEDTGLAAIGTGHAGRSTKDGMASVKFAVVGAGHSVVSAEAKDATGVVVIDSTAGEEAPAMTEREVGLHCLDVLSGLAVWTCEQTSRASTVFSWLATRQATAIHLYSSGTWVRYSVVDDQLVPGSTDFTIVENDKIWISY